MKASSGKCRLILSKNGSFEANINENDISNTKFEKLLGVTSIMNEGKRRIDFNSYFLSQFNFCPLIWMNHNKSINNKINNLRERALRLIYCDHSSNLQELVKKDNSVTIHRKNI